MIENIEQYIRSLGNNQEILHWIQTTGKKYLKLQKTSESELEHIIDYLTSDAAPKRLRKMSFRDAKRKAQHWSEANQKKGRDLIDSEEDIEMVFSFPDGSFVAELKTKKAYQREGTLMGHCLGGYNPQDNMIIYSYRDEKNNPHATFEVRKNSNEISQVKGKGNGEIHPKYIEPVLAFLEYLGMDIRPSEMRYLGYYHVHKGLVGFVRERGLDDQIIEINGEWYAY